MMLRRHRRGYTDRQLVRELTRDELAAQLDAERAKVAALEAAMAAATPAPEAPAETDLPQAPETAPAAPVARRRR